MGADARAPAEVIGQLDVPQIASLVGMPYLLSGLGFGVNEREAVKEGTARAWLLKREIAKVRVGARAVRIPLEAIEALIEAGTVPARERRDGR